MSQLADENGSVSEMAIVDMFTQLIFDAETQLDESGKLLLELLSQVEPTIVDASRQGLSEYLRSLNVTEMIRIVGDVKELFDQHRLMVLSKHYFQSSIFQS